MTSAKLFTAAMLAIGGVAFIGCDNDQGTKTTKTETRTETRTDRASDRTANAVDNTSAAANNAVDNTKDASRNAADKTGNALSNAAQDTKDAARTAADKTGNALNRAGDAVGLRTGSTTQPTAGQQVRDDKKIRDVLQEVCQAALTKNGFDDMVERFHNDDRKRLNDYANNNKDKFNDINAKVAEINDAWKAKYGNEFKIKDRDATFNDQWARISEGSRDLARTASERTGASANVDVSKNGASANVNAGKQQGADQTTATMNDRDYATVNIAASHGMPDLTLNVVYDGLLRGYKIDVPDTLDGQKLHDNLLKHLNMIAQQKDQWPSDVQDAEREVAHHVLAALTDKGDMTSGSNNSSNTNTGSSNR